MKIIGLSQHKIFTLLGTLFNETLPDYFKDPYSIKALENANKKQNKAYVAGFIFFVIGLFILQSDYVQNSGNGCLPDSCFVTGIALYRYLFRKARTKEMREFEIIYNQAINEIKTTSINKEDFNLKTGIY